MTHHPPLADPATSTRCHADVAGVRLSYLDYGREPQDAASDLPVLLCVHGGAANAHWFDFVADGLAKRYHVLSLDLRGHGDSGWAEDSDYSYQRYADDIAEFVQVLGRGPVHLTGHSMGGMVSVVTAATHPGSVASLVVVDSMMQLLADRISTLRGIGSGPGRSFANQDEFIAGFKIRPEGSSALPHIARYMAAHSCRQFPDGAWRNKFDRKVYALRHPIDSFDYWDRIRCPVLVMAGGNSDRITPEVFSRIQAACPQARLDTVPDAGHHVMLDNPDGFVRSGLAFESGTCCQGEGGDSVPSS